MSAKKGEARVALANRESKIGETLFGVLLALERRRPAMTILDNVPGLRQGQQHLQVLQRLRTAGYSATLLDMNPMSYGHPQDGARLYFLCVRDDLLHQGDRDEEWLISFAMGVEAIFSKGHMLAGDNKFLLDVTDNLVREVLLHRRLAHENKLAAWTPRASESVVPK